MTDREQYGEAAPLMDAMRRITIEALSLDKTTGVRYAIGFDATGWPYRAYPVWPDRDDDVTAGYTPAT